MTVLQDGNIEQEVLLIYGQTGWIGTLLGKLLDQNKIKYSYGKARLEDRAAINQDIERVKPTRVLNAAGITGRPNVDWCETHKVETIRANVIGTLNIADVCKERGIHLTIYATGCIFHYDDEEHLQGNGVGFTEEDTPNFVGSFYSYTKAIVESLLKNYLNVLVLRVRMPIVEDLAYARNFITKIIKYDRVIDIPNSMTVLPELLPYSVDMAVRGVTGIVNFTNPGAISHNEILQLYKDYVDPKYQWKNFTVEEQAQVIVAPRSNNLLDTKKIQELCPDILPIRESLIKYVFQPNSIKKGEVIEQVKRLKTQ